MSYIDFPLEINPTALKEAMYEAMQERFPNWQPNEGNPEKWLIDAIVDRLIVPLAELAADVPPEIFHRWGAEIVNVQPQAAVAATVATTWKLIDAAGYTIAAGTQVDLARSGDEVIGFRVANDVTVAPGDEETAAGEVVLEAIEAGEEGNELEGEGLLVDALAFVDSIAVVGKSSGGADAEDPLDYLGRLAETMKTLTPRPIIARDVEILVRNTPGIGRSLAIDNYNAETEETEQEKTTTVFVTDDDGATATAEAKATALADLQAKREINFIFFVEDATYTPVDVKVVAVEREGFSHAGMLADLQATLEDFLNPAIYGRRQPDEPQTWVNTPTLRYQDLVTAINNVQSLDHYTTLEVRKSGGAWKTTDLTLDGIAPLPEVGTLTLT